MTASQKNQTGIKRDQRKEQRFCALVGGKKVLVITTDPEMLRDVFGDLHSCNPMKSAEKSS